MRNVERLFRRETAMTFVAWRQQLRLLGALERLGYGDCVTNVALDVGYSDVAALIARFKAALGVHPLRASVEPNFSASVAARRSCPIKSPSASPSGSGAGRSPGW